MAGAAGRNYEFTFDTLHFKVIFSLTELPASSNEFTNLLRWGAIDHTLKQHWDT